MERNTGEIISEIQKAGTELQAASWMDRPFHQACLLLAHVVLFSLALAPFGQFYLAGVALVPYLLFVNAAPTLKRVFVWGWAAGVLFNGLNLWFLSFVTLPGLFALIIYLGVYWGLLGVLMRVLGLLGKSNDTPHRNAVTSILLIASIWITGEWLRGTVMTGLPWLYLGHTQTPLLAMCQIADATGVYGVSFWLVLVNAWVALFFIDRLRFTRLKLSLAIVTVTCASVLGYGLFRIHETPDSLTPGPAILVVQPSYPQSNSGEKGASIEEIVEFHVQTTIKALDQCKAEGKKIDLVVWSETMMPAVNHQARQGFAETGYGAFITAVHEQLGTLAYRYRVGLLAGGKFAGNFRLRQIKDQKGTPQTYFLPADERNSAYFYEPDGVLSPDRYDKIHLVPFGEFIPFKESIPWLYRLLISLGPADMESYQLTAGETEAMTVFRIVPIGEPTSHPSSQPATSARFVTPICFEDIVPPTVARLFRGTGEEAGQKRADVLINITNDGWFKFNEQPQHLQVATFRSIENRVPTARSVNTGVSGFIDSVGRQTKLLPRFTEGWAAQQVMIDVRLTIYTRYGDLFALACVLVSGAAIILKLFQWQIFGAMSPGARVR